MEAEVVEVEVFNLSWLRRREAGVLALAARAQEAARSEAMGRGPDVASAFAFK